MYCAVHIGYFLDNGDWLHGSTLPYIVLVLLYYFYDYKCYA
jgi:hypothetical protein